jgi:hypothetical protein
LKLHIKSLIRIEAYNTYIMLQNQCDCVFKGWMVVVLNKKCVHGLFSIFFINVKLLSHLIILECNSMFLCNYVNVI